MWIITDMLKNIFIKIFMWIFNKMISIIIDNKLDDFDDIQMFFTEKYHIPSSSKSKNFPMRIYVSNNCINCQIFTNKDNIYNLLNISPIYCFCFLIKHSVYHIFNKTALFKLSNMQYNMLYHKSSPDFHKHCHNNISHFYDMVKNKIEYTSDKKFYDEFMKEL